LAIILAGYVAYQLLSPLLESDKIWPQLSVVAAVNANDAVYRFIKKDEMVTRGVSIYLHMYITNFNNHLFLIKCNLKLFKR